jgi:hypothetical protein
LPYTAVDTDGGGYIWYRQTTRGIDIEESEPASGTGPTAGRGRRTSRTRMIVASN